MKRFADYLLKKISRIIFKIIPNEIKPESILNLIKRELKIQTKLETVLEEDLSKETFQVFGKYFRETVLFKDLSKIREYAVKCALSNDLEQKYYYLEFGTFKGESSIYFSKYLKKLYTFDSFFGLQEDWLGNNDNPKGTFRLKKKPTFQEKNIEIVDGYVENTLENFLKEHNPQINFIHLDLDLYRPTKYTLEKIKPYMLNGSIILFDEFYNYYGWRSGEYKALIETFKDNEFKYRAFRINNQQAVIEFIK